MTVQPLWQKLKELVAFDSIIKKAGQDLKTIHNKIAQLEQSLPQLEAHLLQAQQECRTIQKEVDSLELSVQTLKSQEEKKKRSLETSVSDKMFQALTHELATLIEQRESVDEQLLTMWEKLEKCKKRIVALEKNNENSRVDTMLAITAAQEELQQIQQRLNKAHKRRAEQAEQIPPDWLTKYERMREKVDTPLVPLVSGTCGSCFYQTLPHDRVRIEKNALLPCKNCYRLLYFDTSDEQTSSKQNHETT